MIDRSDMPSQTGECAYSSGRRYRLGERVEAVPLDALLPVS